MSEPSVPGGRGAALSLPCGETKHVRGPDLDKRESGYSYGDNHAVIMDVHPPSRFLPKFLVDILQETIETTDDDIPEFGTAHPMSIVLEEFPEAVVSEDVSENGEFGAGIVWVTNFDSRRLHEITVELTVELMEHVISHAGDDDVVSEFESKILRFDVGEFVDQHRTQRDLGPEPYM